MNVRDIVTPFKVGLLVIVGVVAGVFMMTVLDRKGGAEDDLVVYAMFDDVTGLAEKSRVTMSGIPVGSIDSIELVPGGRARVDLLLRRDIEMREGIPSDTGVWKNGATVTKKQASFIGDFYLEVTPGSAGDLMEDGDEIHNVLTPAGIDQIMERLNRIAGDIQEVTHSLATVFGGEAGRQNIERIVDNLNEILLTLNQFVGENAPALDRILANTEAITADVRGLTATSGESIENILRDSEAIVQEVRYIIGQSSTDLQSGLGTMKGTLSRLQSTLDSLNYSLQNIQDITDKVNEGEGTIGELLNDPTIAQRTEEILTEASDYVGRLSRLRTIIDLRSEYHVQNSALKNVLGLRLQPDPTKYYLIELVDDYRGNTDVVQTDVNTTDGGEVDNVHRTTTVTTSDEFKISVQFARVLPLTDWLAVTGRFGLIESTGGVGSNLLLGEDLEVRADLFDFGTSTSPRFRAFAAYEFLSFAYLAAGLDDAFNGPRRDYFIGLGIRFDDEDLKAILTTTGVPTP